MPTSPSTTLANNDANNNNPLGSMMYIDRGRRKSRRHRNTSSMMRQISRTNARGDQGLRQQGQEEEEEEEAVE
eukprot:52274-Pyramimonas_sp.AAC.1